MPKSLDKEALAKRWIGIVRKGGGKVDEEHSGVVVGASHNLGGNSDGVVQSLVKRVVGFLNGLSQQSVL